MRSILQDMSLAKRDGSKLEVALADGSTLEAYWHPVAQCWVSDKTQASTAGLVSHHNLKYLPDNWILGWKEKVMCGKSHE